MFTTKKHSASLKAFTLVEILVVIAILAILAVVTFVVINPVQRINDANDSTRREDTQSILAAIALFSVDNNGQLPTAGGAALPVVTAANIMTAGVAATTLDSVSPTYMASIPTDPTSVEYRVGRLASGSVIVGITLSDSSVFTKAQ